MPLFLPCLKTKQHLYYELFCYCNKPHDQKQLKKERVYGSREEESMWWGRYGMAIGAGSWLIFIYTKKKKKKAERDNRKWLEIIHPQTSHQGHTSPSKAPPPVVSIVSPNKATNWTSSMQIYEQIGYIFFYSSHKRFQPYSTFT